MGGMRYVITLKRCAVGGGSLVAARLVANLENLMEVIVAAPTPVVESERSNAT